ncbi:hypothetical protein F1C16_19130 [Hymenobacter sp. NBH84]|uniref:hypothetical protein n=1 Tax=Hymenobacter sp. NBH84 TaxID=2596915 RepID=UPI00162625E9|nr:hypothetical protein [Hymenobacter sp. NBH84]QNE41525.1 hypothetical protein F1C16_19130 [Hymenobacter sp. NBH84]
MKQAKATLLSLKASTVKSVLLSPFASSSSLIQDTIVIQDKADIKRLVNDYRILKPYVPGQGRLLGSWQVQVTFLLQNGSEIHSCVYHNDFSDMVFIPTEALKDGLGLDSYFASDSQRDIGRLLQQYKYRQGR